MVSIVSSREVGLIWVLMAFTCMKRELDVNIALLLGISAFATLVSFFSRLKRHKDEGIVPGCVLISLCILSMDLEANYTFIALLQSWSCLILATFQDISFIPALLLTISPLCLFGVFKTPLHLIPIIQTLFICQTLLYRFPLSFSKGEAFIVTQLTSFCLFVFSLTVSQILKGGHEKSLSHSIGVISLFVLVGGIASIFIFAPAAFNVSIGKLNAFQLYLYLILFFLFSVYPLLAFALKEDPLSFLIRFILFDSSHWVILCIWTVSVPLFVFLSTALNMPQIILRKLFHVLVLVLFIPAAICTPLLLALSFSVAMYLFLITELIRVSQSVPLGISIEAYFSRFRDKREQGVLVTSHIYLLLGCALPFWMSLVCGESIVSGLSGIVVLGVSDSVASIVGSAFGRVKWIRSSKTVEGTLSGYAASILFVIFLKTYFGVPVDVWNVALPLFLACLYESCTNQFDNLVLPLYAYASLQIVRFAR